MSSPSDAPPRSFTRDSVRPTRGGLTVKSRVSASAEAADKACVPADPALKR